MNIYIACGLTHIPRDLFAAHVLYIHDLAKSLQRIPRVSQVRYALVDSDPQLALRPSEERASLCYVWDRKMVESADLVIADASFPSTGLGVELQIADNKCIPIIMLIGHYGQNQMSPVRYANPDKALHELQIGEGIVSLMALGIPSLRRKISYDAHDVAIKTCVDAVRTFYL